MLYILVQLYDLVGPSIDFTHIYNKQMLFRYDLTHNCTLSIALCIYETNVKTTSIVCSIYIPFFPNSFILISSIKYINLLCSVNCKLCIRETLRKTMQFCVFYLRLIVKLRQLKDGQQGRDILQSCRRPEVCFPPLPPVKPLSSMILFVMLGRGWIFKFTSSYPWFWNLSHCLFIYNSISNNLK